MTRNWTWIDDVREDVDEAVLNELAAQWSQLMTEAENEGFRRQAMAEDGDEPYFETDEEYLEYTTHLHSRQVVRNTRIRVIENMLTEYGARMMRPYEHWNEDERYMEYMERERY